MRERYGLDAVGVAGPREAMAGAQVVVTAGPILKHPTPAIEPGWLEEGAFACPLDFDSYWQPAALHAVGKFCTDDIGQLEYYRGAGYFQDIPPVYADLGEIVAGKKPGREKSRERILAMNLGLAIEDVAVATRIYQVAAQQNIGVELPL